MSDDEAEASRKRKLERRVRETLAKEKTRGRLIYRSEQAGPVTKGEI